MKTSDTNAFVNQLLVCLLVTICCGGSIGLGTVWMRNQIAITARTNKALELQIADVKRKIDETKALVDGAQSPEALRSLNTGMHLGMVLVSDAQMIRVDGDMVQRLIARTNREIFSDRSALPGIRVALGQ